MSKIDRNFSFLSLFSYLLNQISYLDTEHLDAQPRPDCLGRPYDTRQIPTGSGEWRRENSKK